MTERSSNRLNKHEKKKEEERKKERKKEERNHECTKASENERNIMKLN